jgi:hypothetical protein
VNRTEGPSIQDHFSGLAKAVHGGILRGCGTHAISAKIKNKNKNPGRSWEWAGVRLAYVAGPIAVSVADLNSRPSAQLSFVPELEEEVRRGVWRAHKPGPTGAYKDLQASLKNTHGG